MYTTIFLAALLASTALAKPLRLHAVADTNNVTIHTRQDSDQDPAGTGTSSGITISTYTKPNCKGDGVSNVDLQFYVGVAQQMHSYSLSDDLDTDDQVLAIYAGLNYDATGSNAIDPSLNGNTDAACAQSLYNAEGKQTKAGCHTLPTIVGCAIIMVNEAAN